MNDSAGIVAFFCCRSDENVFGNLRFHFMFFLKYLKNVNENLSKQVNGHISGTVSQKCLFLTLNGSFLAPK